MVRAALQKQPVDFTQQSFGNVKVAGPKRVNPFNVVHFPFTLSKQMGDNQFVQVCILIVRNRLGSA